MAARGKLDKSIVSSPVFPVASQANAVPPMLDTALRIVLKLFQKSRLHIKRIKNSSI